MKIKSIKTSLYVYIFIGMLIPTILFSIIYYVQFDKVITKELVNNSQFNLRYAIKIIDKQLKEISIFSDAIYTNNNVQKLLALSKEESKRKILLGVHSELENQFINSSVARYMRRVIIVGYNDTFLQVGSVLGEGKDYEILQQNMHHNLNIQRGTIDFASIRIQPSIWNKNIKTIPIIREIQAMKQGKIVGYMYIEVDTSLITDIINEYTNDNKLMCVINNNGEYIDNSNGNINLDSFKDLTFARDEGEYKVLKSKNEKYFLISKKSHYTHWNMIELINPILIKNQKQTLYKIWFVLGAVILIITIGIAFFITNNFTKPIIILRNRIRKITMGDFTRQENNYKYFELETINQGINEMIDSINGLIEQNIQQEKNKKDLELKILQSQINPHFLYNTLNTIKWMASLQKALGIEKMVTSLAILLKNIAKGVNEKISLANELDLLEQYIIIQKIRYVEKFEVSYDIQNEELLKCKVIKLILQPIIENAIFHGIKDIKGKGKIKVGIREKDECIMISVKDNGIGISEEKIQILLSGQGYKGEDGVSSMGIYNVHERLMLTYGEAYGITIQSRIEEYTDVLISIPKEY